uniref:Uncharacterized protein n=1 Tax=Anguilla anguilla TaxID=7936 RepID=A0A0E9VPR2_ANGAN
MMIKLMCFYPMSPCDFN